jgi:hypothetical protein
VKQAQPYAVWPRGQGWTVAILRATPEEFARRNHLRFEEGCDDLDAYDLAALADGEVGQVWLFRHRRSPEAGTELQVDTSSSRDDGIAAARRLLGISPDDLTWVSSYEVSPALTRG